MILYIQTAFLGDLLLSIPSLKKLRELYPNKKIHLLCRKNQGSLIKENHLVDEVFDSFEYTKPTMHEIRKLFSNYHYDLLVCPHESFRSLLISRAISADKKIAYKSFLGMFVYHQMLSRPLHLPETLRQLSLLSLLNPGVQMQMAEWVEKVPFQTLPLGTSMQMERYQNPENRRRWRKHYGLSDQDSVVCLAPGSVWPTKQWGLAKYNELTKSLIAEGKKVILVGSASEREMAQQIADENTQVVNYVGKTQLIELAELIACADALVCNDSGAMHVGSLVGTPTISIFGPTVQSFGYQPWNPQAVVLENKQLRCRPCSSHGGKVCPIETHECMTSIPVELVKETVYTQL